MFLPAEAKSCAEITLSSSNWNGANICDIVKDYDENENEKENENEDVDYLSL